MSLNDFDMTKSQTQKVEGILSPSHFHVRNHPSCPAEHRDDAAEGSVVLCGSFLLTQGAKMTERLLKHSSMFPKPGVYSLGELNGTRQINSVLPPHLDSFSRSWSPSACFCQGLLHLFSTLSFTHGKKFTRSIKTAVKHLQLRASYPW